MSNKIKTVYVVHHSHTDIGYTDLQERIIDVQAGYIPTVLDFMKDPENADFRWNCETLFCVERFFENASPEEQAAFCALTAEGRLGLSANYLNFTDLADSNIFENRLNEWKNRFSEHGVKLKTAMIADINGISMGYRDAMMKNGVDFLYMNIHCHHGMYPLYQNQTAFRWENAEGRQMLVWNGEHYHLGNMLGIEPKQSDVDPAETLRRNLTQYLTQCEENGYPYDFIPVSVSGIRCDNAPPSLEILKNINEYNRRYGSAVKIRMVSLSELYHAILSSLADVPVYRGDLTDWWANGVGSTPYAVKHYREALHRYHLCQRLDDGLARSFPELNRTAQDNLLLYAEHTWGHSSTITNPYDSTVLDLEMRKNSYASKAHEAASLMLNRIAVKRGDIMRYYSTSGTIRVCSVSPVGGKRLVEFYIENSALKNAEISDADGNILPCQVSPNPRGKTLSFTDKFKPNEEKLYFYRELPETPQTLNSRKCYFGAERVRDIVNDYDAVTYKLPYEFENAFFRLEYRSHTGVTALIDKRSGRNLLGEETARLFTPLREVTAVRAENLSAACPEEKERSLLGRNIRGQHARLDEGVLENIDCLERGPVFTSLRLRYTLPGTVHADVILKLYEALPRIDFKLELGKTLSTDIESIFMPLTLNIPESCIYARKGTEAFRPGTDQLPGTCMEYTMSDDGLAYVSPSSSVLIAAHDAPLFYRGEMRHHPIRLCEGLEEDNKQPIYSWVMNNTWETNFKMDLSGFASFEYSLWLSDETDPESAMNLLRELRFDPYVLMLPSEPSEE